MSGLYNALFGAAPCAKQLIAILGIAPASYGRLRDAWPSKDGDRIIVYTRNGGGNRQHVGDGKAAPDCRCPGCIMTYVVPKLPGYVCDYDDEHDNTYAGIVFKVPAGYEPMVKEFAELGYTRDPPALWKQLFADMDTVMPLGQAPAALFGGKKK